MASSSRSRNVVSKHVHVPELTLIELHPGVKGSITVMVCRRWDVYTTKGQYISTDYLISDKQGTVMHCFAGGSIAHQFIDRLEEGSIYSLTEFSVVANKEMYMVMKDSAQVVELVGPTAVNKATADPTGFVRHPFQFVTFKDLKPTNNKHFVDVIGFVTAMGKCVPKSSGSDAVEFYLVGDSGQQLSVTLWGALGHQLIDMHEVRGNPFPIILTGMNVKIYSGKITVASSSATILIDDEGIPALKEMKDLGRTINFSATNRDILHSYEKRDTLEKMLQWSRGAEKTDVSVCKNVVEITGIRLRSGWYNLTCGGGDCKKGILRRADKYWCVGCKSHVDFPKATFKIYADLTDNTASAVAVLFDETAKKILGVTADAVLAAQKQASVYNPSAMPPEIANLIGTKHVMELKSSTFYQVGQYESFTYTQALPPYVDLEPQLLNTPIPKDKAANVASPSNKKLKKVGGVPTPRKLFESTKKQLCFDDSDVEVPEEADDPPLLTQGPPEKKRRAYIVETDSENEADVGAVRVSDDDA